MDPFKANKAHEQRQFESARRRPETTEQRLEATEQELKMTEEKLIQTRKELEQSKEDNKDLDTNMRRLGRYTGELARDYKDHRDLTNELITSVFKLFKPIQQTLQPESQSYMPSNPAQIGQENINIHDFNREKAQWEKQKLEFLQSADFKNQELNCLRITQINLSLEVKTLRAQRNNFEKDAAKANLTRGKESRKADQLQTEVDRLKKEKRAQQLEEEFLRLDSSTLREKLEDAHAKIEKLQAADELNKQGWEKVADFASHKAANWDVTEEVGSTASVNRGISNLSISNQHSPTPATRTDRLREPASPGSPSTTTLADVPLKPKSGNYPPAGMTVVREVIQNHSRLL